MSNEKPWFEDICSLFNSWCFVPSADMSLGQKVNSVSRLVLVATGVAWGLGYKKWQYILIIGTAVVVIMYVTGKRTEGFTVPGTITSTPGYYDGNFPTTVVSPVYAEEHQVPPPAYDIVTEVYSDDCDDDEVQEVKLEPASYPYGQYLTRTNLLPTDEYYVHLEDGLTNARTFVNNAFTRNDVAHRDNIMRVYKKKLQRRFRHNCHDTFSPWHSY